MATPLSPSPTTPLRIPLLRFTTQICISMLATLIPALLKKWNMLFLSNLILPTLIVSTNLFLHILNALRSPAHSFSLRSMEYCYPLGICLGCLHQATTFLGNHLVTSGLTQKQHAALHFSLAFLVLSECEFYHMYIRFKMFDSRRDSFRHFLKANVDASFLVSRDPYFFGYVYLTRFRNVEPRDVAVYLTQYLLFCVVGGLANVGVKCVVSPKGDGLEWGEIASAMAGVNVFFAEGSGWQILLNLPALRVVRQANHVGFWAGVDVLEWWKAREGARDEGDVGGDTAFKM